MLFIKSTSLKLDSLNRKLYVDIKNGLNLENLITNESVDPYSPFYVDTLYIDVQSNTIINVFFQIYTERCSNMESKSKNKKMELEIFN